jgi:hypothetical protein
MSINLKKKALNCLLLTFIIFQTAACAQMTGSLSTENEKLRLACLNEAEIVDGKSYPFRAPRRGHTVPKIPAEVYEAKALCRQMTEELLLAQSRNTRSSQESKVAFTQKCDRMLEQCRTKHPSAVGHIKSMTSLCQK